MAHKKAGGSTKNLNTAQPKYLGVKLYAGEVAKTGDVLVRQRGTKMVAGANVGVGRDHTLFALAPGVVSFKTVRKVGFDGRKKIHSSVVVTAA